MIIRLLRVLAFIFLPVMGSVVIVLFIPVYILTGKSTFNVVFDGYIDFLEGDDENETGVPYWKNAPPPPSFKDDDYPETKTDVEIMLENSRISKHLKLKK